MTAPNASGVRKRHRLPPEVRAEQILRAALVEFSRHGVAAARMDDIARRAGLSKGGLYAHFKSKDEIFETLLVKMLTPTFTSQEWLLADGRSLREVVASFLDHLYARLADPDVIATLKLLITEGSRVPHLVHYWRQEIMQKYLDGQQAILEESAANGLLRHSVLIDHVNLLFTPVLHAAVWQMTFGESFSQEEFATFRHAHERMLLELLEPSV